jgi:two-component system sensor histidine kinase HydH
VQFSDGLAEYFNMMKNELQLYSKFRGEIVFENKVLLLSVTPSSSGNKFNGFLFVEVDISDQRKLEEQLVKSEKLAALGKMAAVLAHEIKTPLTSIKMNADIISEALQLKEDEKENFASIQTEINRLNNLVKDVLQFSRQMELEYTKVNLYNLIESIKLQLINKLKSKYITFLNNINKIEFSADEHKLTQVFLNIIDNSIEAVSKNGTIEVSSELDARLEFVKIFITDNGNGINPDAKVFEPFFTTKSSGTGLGLAVAQKIVDQHKGSIKLISSEPATVDRPGRTVFQITLPVNEIKRLDNIKTFEGGK